MRTISMRIILKVLTLSVAMAGSTSGTAFAEKGKPFFEDRVVINKNTWIVSGERHSESTAVSCEASFQYGENDGSYSTIGRNIETGEVFIVVHNTDWSINDAPGEGKVQFNSYSQRGQRIKNGELRAIALDKNTVRLPDLDAGDMFDVLTKASVIRLIMPNNLSNIQIGPLGPALANKMADCFTAAQKELPTVNKPASAPDLGPLQKLFDDAQPWDVSVRTQNGLVIKGKFYTIINNVKSAGYDCAIDEQKMPEFVVRCTGYRDQSTQLNQNDRWDFTFNKINEKEVQLTRAYAKLTGKETSGPEIEGLADLLFRPDDNQPPADNRKAISTWSSQSNGVAMAISNLSTPAPGSPDRVAIMDAIRLATNWVVKLKVDHLMVLRQGNKAIAIADVSDASGQSDNSGIFELEGLNRQWRALYTVGGGGGADDCATERSILKKMIAKADEYSVPREIFPESFWRLVSENKSADENGACSVSREF